MSWGFSFPLTKPPGNARLILVERSMGAACRWRRFKITWGNEKPYYRIAFLYLILDERGKKDFLNLCFPFLIFRGRQIKSTAMISERSPRIRNIQFQNLSGSLSQQIRCQFIFIRSLRNNQMSFQDISQTFSHVKDSEGISPSSVDLKP